MSPQTTKISEILVFYRAAKLRLLNFSSLFRDLQNPTRFSGGGVVAGFFRDLHGMSRRDSVGGGSSRIFPLSPRAYAVQWGGGGG